MKTLKLALLAGALAVTPAAAFAQDVGATIYGNDGNAVGTVTEVNDQVVVIDTGKHKAPCPSAWCSMATRAKASTPPRTRLIR